MMSTITNVFLSSITVLALALSSYQPLMPDRSASVEYDFSQPVPASEQQEDSWFDDSAFIGHSLIEGFEMFSKVDAGIHYFSTTGLSAAGVAITKKLKMPNGGMGTLVQGLSQKDFSKIYIMLGVNEISTSKEKYKNNMTAVIETIRANQPEGIPIYVLNITPTTVKKSGSSAFNQANVKRLNEAIAELCQEQKCYLVDLWSCFADENGYLPAEISTDGVHLKAPQYRVMADYILSHTVEK